MNLRRRFLPVLLVSKSFFTLILSLVLIVPTYGATKTFFVALSGNDSWSGQLPAPNKAKHDGPFLTIERAQRAAEQAAFAASVNVEIRGGTYYLTQSLKFTPADSGTRQNPVVYEAYKSEKPVLCGGRLIDKCQINSLGQWETTLPQVATGEWYFEQLFVNDGRRFRPRLPSNGYYKIASAEPVSPTTAGQGHTQFQYNAGEIKSTWHNIDDVIVLPFHIWGVDGMHIHSVDSNSNIVQLSQIMSNSDPDYSKLPSGGRYLVDNVKEALDEPGQWYLDHKSGALTYIPRHGETPQNTAVVAPDLEQLLLVTGNLAKGEWVHDITFRGLTFSCTNWVTPAEYADYGQADVLLPSAISLVGARNCKLDCCTVDHTGCYGISLGVACHDDSVARCHLSDLGAGGIKIGDPAPGGVGYDSVDPEMTTSENTVTDSDLYGGGRIFPAGVGIWIGNSYGNTIERCSIHNFYYSAVSLGWTWGYGASLAYHNSILDNDIYQIGQGVLSDMGGIYSVGARSGTLEEHNRIHDVVSYSYGGWGIYFDEGSSNVIAKNNLVYMTSASGFHQHYGANNLLTNNIIAFGTQAQLMRTRPEDHLSFTISHNIVLSAGTPFLGSNWSGNQYALDYNDYWVVGGVPVVMNGLSFDKWQATGQDIHSIAANPGFQDATKFNFHFKSKESALKIGFLPFDIDHFGPNRSYVDNPLPDSFPTAPPLPEPE